MAEFINTALGFVAQQNFVCGGVAYSTGDAFSIEGLSERELERLWRYRRIRNGEPVGASLEQLEADPAPDAAPVAAVTDQEASPAAGPEQVAVAIEPTASPEGLEFVNTGAGWYNVELAGVVINDKKIKGLEAAKAWAAEQGYC